MIPVIFDADTFILNGGIPWSPHLDVDRKLRHGNETSLLSVPTKGSFDHIIAYTWQKVTIHNRCKVQKVEIIKHFDLSS